MLGLAEESPIALLDPIQQNEKYVSPLSQQRKVDFFLDMRGSCLVWLSTWGGEKDSSKLDSVC